MQTLLLFLINLCDLQLQSSSHDLKVIGHALSSIFSNISPYESNRASTNPSTCSIFTHYFSISALHRRHAACLDPNASRYLVHHRIRTPRLLWPLFRDKVSSRDRARHSVTAGFLGLLLRTVLTPRDAREGPQSKCRKYPLSLNLASLKPTPYKSHNWTRPSRMLVFLISA